MELFFKLQTLLSRVFPDQRKILFLFFYIKTFYILLFNSKAYLFRKSFFYEKGKKKYTVSHTVVSAAELLSSKGMQHKLYGQCIN